MTLLREAAHSSPSAALTKEAVPTEPEFETPFIRVIRQRAREILRRTHEPFVTDGYMYPPQGPTSYELPLGVVVVNGRLIENPWNIVIERMVLNWGKMDMFFDSTTHKGELRQNIRDLFATVDLSDKYQPKVIMQLGGDLAGSLKNLDVFLGAMDSAAQQLIKEFSERHDSSNNEQLYILQTANPFS